MTAQLITELTASKLVDGIHKLDITIAVLTEQMEVQNRWNQEQQKINVSVTDKLSDIAKNDVKRDERIKALEGWKNWLSGVFTALLLSVLGIVIIAAFYNAYGGHP